MPLLKVSTSVAFDRQTVRELMLAASKELAEATGKPETYMMVVVDQAAICMDRAEGPAVYADLRAIGGLTGGVPREVTKRLCALFESRLGVPPGRVYITFTDVQAPLWGWNGKTFG